MRLDCNHPLKIRLQLFLVTLSSFILEKELPYNEDYHKKKKKNRHILLSYRKCRIAYVVSMKSVSLSYLLSDQDVTLNR